MILNLLFIGRQDVQVEEVHQTKTCLTDVPFIFEINLHGFVRGHHILACTIIRLYSLDCDAQQNKQIGSQG
jgi:hypothetical protein